MQNPALDVFIFDSTGRHLNGKMDASKYRSLARQLSAKMNALHFESTGNEDEFIFGCSLWVEQANDREERVFCIAVHNSGSTPDMIDSFYSEIKAVISDLKKVNYRIIGLWEEGDLDTLKEVSVPEEIMQYVFGKIVAGEKITIKSVNPVAGISLIKQMSGCIGSLPAVKLVLSVSHL